jgi:hypothetical protein
VRGFTTLEESAMAAQSLSKVESKVEGVQQLALLEAWKPERRQRNDEPEPSRRVPLCAGCREKEARYGFRDDDEDPTLERARTLCFACFRAELTRREAVKAHLARGWNGRQASLPLEETLKELTRRRRRAQIAARRALGI